MAAISAPLSGIPLSFKPHIPITPPPDCLNFTVERPEHRAKSNPSSQSLANMAETPSSSPTLAGSAPEIKQTQSPSGSSHNHGNSDFNGDFNGGDATAKATSNQQQQQAHHQQQQQQQQQYCPPANMDPRCLAMVSRIAAYYQQRSQAIANYQHQKCQAWANMQRAKCQEMTQAAMLVVAWYVRDRIQRRRRRDKRRFRKGLQERSKATTADAGVSRARRVETTVDKWVKHIPRDVLLSPNTAAVERPIDVDELHFSMETDSNMADKDDKLYAMADSMIKSQLMRIDVPLMGALSFASDDEDDSDTECISEEDKRWRPSEENANDDDEMGGMDDADEDDDDDDDYLYEDENDDDNKKNNNNNNNDADMEDEAHAVLKVSQEAKALAGSSTGQQKLTS